MCSLGANLRLNAISVKQNARCFPQNPAIPPPFRKPVSVAELQKRDQIFPRKAEDISKLGRHIRTPRNQRRLETSDHSVESTPVVKAIRLYLDDSPLPLQMPKQSRNRAAVA